MAPIERDKSMRVRVSEEEVAMLRALADRDGVSASDVIRLLVRRAYADAFGAKPPKKKAAK